MNTKELKKIYRKIKHRGIAIARPCEVGVYLPETSNIIDFIKDGSRASLVEADPDTVKILKEYFKNYAEGVAFKKFKRKFKRPKR